MLVHAPNAASGMLLVDPPPMLTPFAAALLLLLCPNRPTKSVSTKDNNGSVIIPARAGRAMAIVWEVQL